MDTKISSESNISSLVDTLYRDPLLEDLKKKRLGIYVMILGPFFLAAPLVCDLLGWIDSSAFYALGTVLGLVCLGFGYSHYVNFRKLFKERFVQTLVKAMNPQWAYEMDLSPQDPLVKDYQEYHLNPPGYVEFNFSDGITGHHGETAFRCAKATAVKEHAVTKVTTELNAGLGLLFYFFEKLGQKKNLVFQMGHHQPLEGKTYVRPDSEEKILGRSLSKYIQSLGSSWGALVKLEDLEFERRFRVHSTHELEARLLLSPLMMERLVQLSQSLGRPFQVLFIPHRIFFVLDLKRLPFEPSLWGALLKKGDLELWTQLFSVVGFMIDEVRLKQFKKRKQEH